MYKLFKNKVDFLICGAQKCGTTSLHHYLKLHPQIGIPEKKELHFFDNEELFSKKIDYHFYYQNFKFSDINKVYGEATPIYILERFL